MNDRQSPLFLSFPIGTWFLTQVRVHVLFPLVLVALCWRLGLQLGAAFGAILLLSVLMHEFGHVIAARMTGGMADEILLWPLGGLAFVQPAGTVSSKVLTAAAGPFTNFMLLLPAVPIVATSGHLSDILNPLVLPIAEISRKNLVHDLLLLTFSANWLLLLINLIPVHPLDGGRIAHTLLNARLGGEMGNRIHFQVGFVCAFLLMFAGLMQDLSWLILIGALIVVLNMHEIYQMQVSEAYDDSFMGYDFSQGYTSLEKSAPPVRTEPAPGMFQRWRERRRERREQRKRERQQQIESQMDAILAKVHTEGVQSLSEAEKRILREASDLLRDKGKPNP